MLRRRIMRLAWGVWILNAVLLSLPYLFGPPTNWHGQDAEFRVDIRTSTYQPLLIEAISLDGQPQQPAPEQAVIRDFGAVRVRQRGQAEMLLTLRLRFLPDGDTHKVERVVNPPLYGMCGIWIYYYEQEFRMSACTLVSDSISAS